MLFFGQFEASFKENTINFDCNDEAKGIYCLCYFHDHESRLVGSCLGR